jgi:hypothetical protein
MQRLDIIPANFPMVLPEHRVMTVKARAEDEEQLDFAAATAENEVHAKCQQDLDIPRGLGAQGDKSIPGGRGPQRDRHIPGDSGPRGTRASQEAPRRDTETRGN